jgi:hypothetical protein
MGEASQQQIFDLLCEVADDMERLDAKLDDILVLTRTINYEAELGLQRIGAAGAQYRSSKESLSP